MDVFVVGNDRRLLRRSQLAWSALHPTATLHTVSASDALLASLAELPKDRFVAVILAGDVPRHASAPPPFLAENTLLVGVVHGLAGSVEDASIVAQRERVAASGGLLAVGGFWGRVAAFAPFTRASRAPFVSGPPSLAPPLSENLLAVANGRGPFVSGPPSLAPPLSENLLAVANGRAPNPCDRRERDGRAEPQGLFDFGPKRLWGGLAGTAATLLAHLTTRALPASTRVVCHPFLDVGRDPRRRFLLAVTTLHRGGAERLVLDIFHALCTEKAPLTPVLARTHADLRSAFPEPPGTVFIPRGREASPLPFLGVDVLYLHLLGEEATARLCDYGAPVAVCVHNAPEGWPWSGAPPAAVSLFLGCGEAVTAALRKVLPATKVRPLSNGLDFRFGPWSRARRLSRRLCQGICWRSRTDGSRAPKTAGGK